MSAEGESSRQASRGAVSPHQWDPEARGGWKRRQLTSFQLADAGLSRAGAGISSGFVQHLPGQGWAGGRRARLEIMGAAESLPTPTCRRQGDGHPRRGGPGQFRAGLSEQGHLQERFGIGQETRSGLFIPGGGCGAPASEAGFRGRPSPGRGQQGSPAHPSAEAARPTPWSGSPSPAPGRCAEASAGARQLGPPPHGRTASRVWVAGRGGRRGADVAARPAAGEAERRLPARPSPARGCGCPVATAAALGAGF